VLTQPPNPSKAPFRKPEIGLTRMGKNLAVKPFPDDGGSPAQRRNIFPDHGIQQPTRILPDPSLVQAANDARRRTPKNDRVITANIDHSRTYWYHEDPTVIHPGGYGHTQQQEFVSLQENIEHHEPRTQAPHIVSEQLQTQVETVLECEQEDSVLPTLRAIRQQSPLYENHFLHKHPTSQNCQQQVLIKDQENNSNTAPGVHASIEVGMEGMDENRFRASSHFIQEHESQQSRASSRQPSRVQSRQSQRSNMSASISNRPVRAEDLQKGRVSEPTIGVQNSPKVQKSTSGRSETKAQVLAKLKEEKKAHKARSNEIQQKIHITELEVAEDSVKAEVQKLEEVKAQSEKTILRLSEEKEEQQKKLDHLANKAVEYKNHMNKVVESQDFLIAEAAQMKNELDLVVAGVNRIQQDKKLREKEEAKAEILRSAKYAICKLSLENIHLHTLTLHR